MEYPYPCSTAFPLFYDAAVCATNTCAALDVMAQPKGEKGHRQIPQTLCTLQSVGLLFPTIFPQPLTLFFFVVSKRGTATAVDEKDKVRLCGSPYLYAYQPPSLSSSSRTHARHKTAQPMFSSVHTQIEIR